MAVRSGTATGTVAASPSAVFDAVTDIDRLPAWNKTIRRVVERPDALREGAEWVVAVKPPGMPEWLSRATTVEYDPEGRRFRYRTCTEDGNPSWAMWSWQAEAGSDGTVVTVSWELHPETFARRVLLSRVRNRALRREVRESINDLESIAARS
jgi:uncharacterized protein YndB with AHSA1/START domain